MEIGGGNKLTKETIDKYLISDAIACEECYSFVNTNLEILIRHIEDGANKTCSDICSSFNGTTFTECLVVCDAVGAIFFVAILEEADPDPIYICQMAKLCDINVNGNASITSVSSDPPIGAQNTTFWIDVEYEVYNEIGTGTIEYQLYAPGQGVVTYHYILLADVKEGMHSSKYNFTTIPNEDNNFLPGLYMVDVFLCDGLCDSTRPNSKIYDLKRTSFVISGDIVSGTASSSGLSLWQ
ncbi:hypothetical protein SAMD00019534_124980 [Acytostelium subglobosum LB1]|uniref:hypothetical protein n=1 Tax=Acytostelium subglobosum LB1 TaxID=1410327 RepID=UPI00064498AD|nr:hypothetical protein SAMD00019534_124980 [Acytostelium subglobosum LB1]GAM29322.1 hypothetical protein SAMD00019534_124980 [Acytostelium subglobosum LB1]|eukprot:XP_012747749.1 hypothetical protein SAMD00019534_124980 [Acytostelium subglobosum LB1]